MKRILSILVLFVLLSGVAYSNGQSESDSKKLVIWGKQSVDRKTDELVDSIFQAWGEANGVEVEYVTIASSVQKEKYAAAFESGAVPDIITFDGDFCKYYSTKDVLNPVDDLYAELNQRGGGMFEGVLPVLEHEDHLYGIPFKNDLYYYYVREDLVKGVGEELPTSWDDIRKISLKIKEKYGIDGYGTPLSDTNDAEFSMRILLWSFDSHIFDENGDIAFNSPESVEAFDYIRKLYLEDKTVPTGAITWDDSGNNESYQMKRSAFVLNSGSVYRWMKENDLQLHADTVLSRMPAGPRGTRTNLTACWAVSLPKDSPNTELAKDCLRYFYELDNYNSMIESAGSSYLPVYRDLFETPFWTSDPKFKDLKQMLEEAKVVGYKGPSSEAASEMFVRRILMNAVDEMLVNGISPEDAVLMAHNEFELAKMEVEKD